VIKERIRPSQQIYNNYTEEDFYVWKTLFNRQHELLSKHASEDFIKSLEVIGFSAEKIPDFAEVNNRLKSLTGWQLNVVPCISPVDIFFELLSKRTFTATCWLRSISELDYLEEPDMFHDVFGHAPLLTNVDYDVFFKTLADLAMRYITNHAVIKMLQRLYWFTIEFGLIHENNKVKIYGAGIASSRGEVMNALNHRANKRSFNVIEIMHHQFRTDVIQEQYYVIESFEQLKDSIAEIEEEIIRVLNKMVQHI